MLPATTMAAKPPIMPASPTMAAQATPSMGFAHLAKQMNLGHLKLNKNPEVGRQELMQHLKQHYGPSFERHPQVQALLTAYNTHTGTGQQDLNLQPTGQAGTLRTILGGPQ